MGSSRGRDKPDDLLPKDVDAEELAVGACLVDPAAFQDCTRYVKYDEFTVPVYRAAWRAMERRHAAGQPIDIELVTRDVEVEGATGEWGGPPSEALTAALMRVPWSMHGSSYARRVHEAALRRSIIESSTAAAQWAYDPGGDVPGMVVAVTTLFQQYDEAVAGEETGEIEEAFADIEAGVGHKGLSTGIACYDEWSPGLRPGEIHTIGGYSGAGKTWTLCQIINAVLDQGASVAMFSLEMPTTSFVRRLLANRVGAFAMKWGRPGVTFLPGELERVLAAREFLLESGLRVYHEQRSLPQITAVVRSTKPKVVGLDYLQLMDDDGGTEYETLTANCKGLQRLSQKANTCVVMLSQVNEAHQNAGGDTRTLGLKGSGSIGSVSDFVLTVQATKQAGILELAAGKNRHGEDRYAGATATVRMDKTTGRIAPITVYPSSRKEEDDEDRNWGVLGPR